MENHHFLIGDTSSIGGFPNAMLVYRSAPKNALWKKVDLNFQVQRLNMGFFGPLKRSHAKGESCRGGGEG